MSGGAAVAGAGAFCWALTGAAPSASDRARPAADNIREKFVIPVLLDYGVTPFNHSNSLRARQHHRAGKADEQPVLDHAGDQAQQACQARRILYSSEMGVDDPVAAIGDKNVAVLAFPQHHLPGNPAFGKRACHGATGRGETERNHLDRQRKAAEHIDPFGLVRDHDHAIGGGRHDLFPEQRAAAALDEVERAVDLVGAVDGEIETVDLVQRRQPHAALFGLRAGRFRGRNAHHIQAGADLFTEQIDEMLGGRAGAEAKLHAVAHFLKRARRRLPFQRIHFHVPTMPLKGYGQSTAARPGAYLASFCAGE